MQPEERVASELSTSAKTPSPWSPLIRIPRLDCQQPQSAPAGIATRNIGKVVATCTSDTMSGSGLRLVINQPEAALYIQPPMFETTVAVQITAKTECLDLEQKTLQPLDNPFGTRLSPMS
jgi:hypothetical protein